MTETQLGKVPGGTQRITSPTLDKTEQIINNLKKQKPPKRGRPPTPKQTIITESGNIRVNPKRIHSLGLWKNPREPYTVRVDKGLAKAFSRVSKAVYGSTCRAIETYMAAVVGAYNNHNELREYPENTTLPSISIGEIKIERNIRPRRMVDPVPEDSAGLCCFNGCGEAAVCEAFYKPLKENRKLCDKHVRLLTESGATSWRFF